MNITGRTCSLHRVGHLADVVLGAIVVAAFIASGALSVVGALLEEHKPSA